MCEFAFPHRSYEFYSRVCGFFSYVRVYRGPSPPSSEIPKIIIIIIIGGLAMIVCLVIHTACILGRPTLGNVYAVLQRRGFAATFSMLCRKSSLSDFSFQKSIHTRHESVMPWKTDAQMFRIHSRCVQPSAPCAGNRFPLCKCFPPSN